MHETLRNFFVSKLLEVKISNVDFVSLERSLTIPAANDNRVSNDDRYVFVPVEMSALGLGKLICNLSLPQ